MKVHPCPSSSMVTVEECLDIINYLCSADTYGVESIPLLLLSINIIAAYMRKLMQIREGSGMPDLLLIIR